MAGGIAKTEGKQRRPGFQKGQSGNPRGRPQGSRHKATLAALAALEGDLTAITQTLIEKAKAGEAWAITLIFNKLVPNARPLPVSFPLPPRLATAADLKKTIAAILRAVARGAMSLEDGRAAAEILQTLALAQAVEDLEGELGQLAGGEGP